MESPKAWRFCLRIMPVFIVVVLCIIAAALSVIAIELRSQSQMLMKHESAIDTLTAGVFAPAGAGASMAADVGRKLASRPPAMAAPAVDTPLFQDESDKAIDKVASTFAAPDAHGGALASKKPRRRLTADCSCYGTDWSATTIGSTAACAAFQLGDGQMPDCQLISAVASNTAALSCASSGRRLETEEEVPYPSVDEVLSKYLQDNSDFAAKMDAASVDKLKELGQHFGLPAHA